MMHRFLRRAALGAPALLLSAALLTEDAGAQFRTQFPAPQPTSPRPATAPAPAARPAAAADTGLTAIVGVVFDSVAVEPLRQAFVQVVRRDDPTVARGTTSDSAGRFRLDSVPAGEYVIGFQHPRLDELLLESPLLGIRVGGAPTQEVFLGIPGAGSLARSFCPGADTTAALVGRVRDADSSVAAGGATVVVSWLETTIERNALRRQIRAVNTTADAEGRYTLCGIPGDAAVSARASAPGGRTSGEVAVTIPAGSLMQRDMLVAVPGAARRGTARVAGRVRKADGSPLAGAQVQVFGSGRTATTDASGAFTLDALPPGTSTLEARAVGYTPERRPVDLENNQLATAELTLDALPPVLDTVVARGRNTGPATELTRFRQRQSGGMGRFLGPEDLARRNAVSPGDLLRTLPGIQIVPRGSRSASITIRNCRPSVFVDGMFIAGAAGDLGAVVQAHEVTAVEVYPSASETPPEFQRVSAGCGAVAFWTKAKIAP